MAIEILKIAHFFSVISSQKLVSIWARYLSATKRSHLALLENVMDHCYGLLVSELPLARCQPLKIQDFGIFW